MTFSSNETNWRICLWNSSFALHLNILPCIDVSSVKAVWDCFGLPPKGRQKETQIQAPWGSKTEVHKRQSEKENKVVQFLFPNSPGWVTISLFLREMKYGERNWTVTLHEVPPYGNKRPGIRRFPPNRDVCYIIPTWILGNFLETSTSTRLKWF